MHEIVLHAEHVLDEPQVGRALRAEALQPADVDVADRGAAGHERRQRLRGVRLDVLADARAAEADPRGVQRARTTAPRGARR